MLNFLIAACLCGFIASAPVGPVNIQLANHCFAKRRRGIIYFLAGVIIVDLAYVALAFWSYFFLESSFQLDFGRAESIISGGLIMALGLYFLWKNQQRLNSNKTAALQLYRKAWQYFAEGFLLCASNLMLFMLWFFIAGIFEQYQMPVTSSSALLSLLVGIFIGDLLWFWLLLTWLHKKREQMNPRQTYRLQKLLAISLVLFGLFTACR